MNKIRVLYTLYNYTFSLNIKYFNFWAHVFSPISNIYIYIMQWPYHVIHLLNLPWSNKEINIMNIYVFSCIFPFDFCIKKVLALFKYALCPVYVHTSMWFTHNRLRAFSCSVEGLEYLYYMSQLCLSVTYVLITWSVIHCVTSYIMLYDLSAWVFVGGWLCWNSFGKNHISYIHGLGTVFFFPKAEKTHNRLLQCIKMSFVFIRTQDVMSGCYV